VRGKGLLLGLQVRGRNPAAAKRHTQRIVNTLASRHRVLIGHEGPRGDILKLRPPLPFRAEHADLLVQAIDAAAGAVDF
jgi:4-aminobutyrate aminotransferase-like enzyme